LRSRYERADDAYLYAGIVVLGATPRSGPVPLHRRCRCDWNKGESVTFKKWWLGKLPEVREVLRDCKITEEQLINLICLFKEAYEEGQKQHSDVCEVKSDIFEDKTNEDSTSEIA
jgi:hypothetical protein